MELQTETERPARLAGLKVLVIDDSKTIRRTAETLLAREGCEVFTAVDGFDALSKVADHRPDIIFVDIMMPRLDGYQACSLIKRSKAFRTIPVIMLSSKDGLFRATKWTNHVHGCWIRKWKGNVQDDERQMHHTRCRRRDSGTMVSCFLPNICAPSTGI